VLLEITKDLKQGFYLEYGKPCKFADSKQISSSRYKLQHDLYYVAKNGAIYLIKKGFIHDGASKGFLKRFGRYTNPAILHDGLYGSHRTKRGIADGLFDESMEFCEVQYVRRNVYWSVVRSVGWIAYNGKSKETIEKNCLFVEIYHDGKS